MFVTRKTISKAFDSEIFQINFRQAYLYYTTIAKIMCVLLLQQKLILASWTFSQCFHKCLQQAPVINDYKNK